MSKDTARHRSNDELKNGKLLNDIETIGKALYLDKNLSKSSSSFTGNLPTSIDKINVPNLKSKHLSGDQSTKDKKSFWNWKPLKALSQVRHRRFNCCFTLEVHTIEGLPSNFNDLSLCVHWKRRDGDAVTSPIKVIEGAAEFEQKLTHTCSVYGSRNGPHHSAKYDAKHFLLYAAIHGNPKLDLGKHRVDLTRLLPLTLEELEEEKSSGTWTTSFKLLGEAKGALLNVSFGYLVLGDGVAPNNKNVLKLLDSKSARSNVNYNHGDGKGSLRRAGSLPANQMPSTTSRSVDDIKILHEVPPLRASEFSSSVSMLYQKFDEETSDSLVDVKHEIEVSACDVEPVKLSCCSTSEGRIVNEYNDADFSFTEKGMGSLEEKAKADEDKAKIVDENDIKDPEKPSQGHIINGYKDSDSSFTEMGTESPEEKAKLEEDWENIVDELDVKNTELPGVHIGVGNSFQQETDIIMDKVVVRDSNAEGKDICTKESLLEDLQSVLSHVAEFEKEGVDTPETKSESSDHENQDGDRPHAIIPSDSLDDFTDSVADEFLSMLELEDSSVVFHSDTEPDSPRERLLREFQKEAEASGCSLFGLDIDEDDVADYDYYAPTISGWEEFSDDSNFLSDGQLEYPKIRAKVMEDMETQALMQEWGLDEKAFQSSPPHSSGPCGGFGSPIDLPPNESPELPPLGEGLGSFIQTENGGFLRSMNPILFRNAKSGGSLIMQVSSPVVVPAELGSGVMDTLQHLASAGLEQLSIEANKLMPLEDITGKTMQHMAWKSAPQLQASERQNLLQAKREDNHMTSAAEKRVKGKSKKFSSSSAADGVDSDYVSLEDLAPLAIDKIEALSLEGLRIQSGMSDEEAPSNITAQSLGEFSALEGKKGSSTGSVGLEGAVGLQLLDVKDSGTDGTDGDGLMGLSLTLDEWMRLDSGEIDEEEQLSERTTKLLAAHHANYTELYSLRRKQGKGSGRRCGLLGNNFTVALMVQLRDPLRDYEPVGTPMLALIQVERIFIPPKPKIYCTVADATDSNDGDDDLESVTKEKVKIEPKEEKIQEQDLIPQYKISEVHVAGLKPEPGKKKLWGNAAQQQSGSRWLLANGMGKGKKNLFTKPKVAGKSPSPAAITSQAGDTLWSISARYNGSGAKWKELAALNPHIRNPNVILPNEIIKLR